MNFTVTILVAVLFCFHLTSAILQTMLFVNFSTELDAFKSKYHDVAMLYKGNGVSFLLGDVEAGEGAFEVS